MCATYWLGDGVDIEIANLLNELNEQYGDPTLLDERYFPDGAFVPKDVYPKYLSEVITHSSDGFVLDSASWGFMRDEKNIVFNTRSDKVLYSYFWKSAYLNNRGFVVCSGFYEHRRNEEGKNVRYLFTLPASEIICIASILEERKTQEGETKLYYSLITTEANESVSPIHSRMPLILSKEQLYSWVTDVNFANEMLKTEMPVLAYQPKDKDN